MCRGVWGYIVDTSFGLDSVCLCVSIYISNTCVVGSFHIVSPRFVLEIISSGPFSYYYFNPSAIIFFGLFAISSACRSVWIYIVDGCLALDGVCRCVPIYITNTCRWLIPYRESPFSCVSLAHSISSVVVLFWTLYHPHALFFKFSSVIIF